MTITELVTDFKKELNRDQIRIILAKLEAQDKIYYKNFMRSKIYKSIKWKPEEK